MVEINFNADYYGDLALDQTATYDDICAKFIYLTNYIQNNEEFTNEEKEIFQKRITEAYDVLSNSLLRNTYNIRINKKEDNVDNKDNKSFDIVIDNLTKDKEELVEKIIEHPIKDGMIVTAFSLIPMSAIAYYLEKNYNFCLPTIAKAISISFLTLVPTMSNYINNYCNKKELNKIEHRINQTISQTNYIYEDDMIIENIKSR